VQLPEIRTVLRSASARDAYTAVERARKLSTGADVRESLVDAFGDLIEGAIGPDYVPWKAGGRPAGPARPDA
jgi:hypothetical protein